MNSSLYRALAYTIAMPKGGFPYKQYVQWNVAVLPVIPMESEPTLTKRIATEVEAARKNSQLGEPAFATRIDELVGELFGFTSAETARMKQFLEFSLGRVPLWESR